MHNLEITQMALNCGTEKYVVGESNNKISHSDEKEQPTTTHSDTDASHRRIVEKKKKKARHKRTRPLTPFTGGSKGGQMNPWSQKSG